MRIAVVGAGGVGGYIAARLAASGAEVSVLARGEHLSAIKQHGLRVTSPRGDLLSRVHASSRPSDLGSADAVIFAVKSFDTDATAATIHPLIAPSTIVASVQNGIDNEERIGRQVGIEHVAGGVAFLFASIARPGVIEHRGGPDRVIIGELGGGGSRRLGPLVDVLKNAGFAAELSENIRADLWSKLAFICAQAGITAASRLPIGKLREDEAALRVFRSILAEVRDVAVAEGVVFSCDIVDQLSRSVQSLPAEGRSSLHDDLVSGHRIELEALHGEVVRRAEAAGVDVPATAALYGVLHPYVQ